MLNGAEEMRQTLISGRGAIADLRGFEKGPLGRVWQGRLSGLNKLGRVAAELRDTSVGRTSWEGWQAESWTSCLSRS